MQPVRDTARPGPTNAAGFALLAVMAMLGAVALGAVAYITLSDQNDLVRLKRTQSSESSQDLNIANLAIAGALLQFPINQNPADATNPAFRPAMYPDPYISVANGSSAGLWFKQQPPRGAVWSPLGSQGLEIAGFDATNLPDLAVKDLFLSGSAATLGGSSVPRAQPSTVRYIRPIVGQNYLITAIVVDSTSTLEGKVGRASNHVQALLSVPTPPPPVVQITSTYAANAPLQMNQNFNLTATLYGIAYDVNARVVGNGGSFQDFNLANGSLAAQAGSIRNTGLPLTFALAANSALVQPINASVGTLTVLVTATGPGNTTSQEQVTVYVELPVTCSFNPATASVQVGASQRFDILGQGPVASTQIGDAFSGATSAAGSLVVTVPSTASVGQTYSGQGRVFSSSGASAGCTYAVTALAPPPVPPPPPPPPPPPTPPATVGCVLTPNDVTIEFWDGTYSYSTYQGNSVTVTLTSPSSYSSVVIEDPWQRRDSFTNSITIHPSEVPYYQDGQATGFALCAGSWVGWAEAIGTDGTRYRCSYTVHAKCSQPGVCVCNIWAC